MTLRPACTWFSGFCCGVLTLYWVGELARWIASQGETQEHWEYPTDALKYARKVVGDTEEEIGVEPQDVQNKYIHDRITWQERWFTLRLRQHQLSGEAAAATLTEKIDALDRSQGELWHDLANRVATLEHIHTPVYRIAHAASVGAQEEVITQEGERAIVAEDTDVFVPDRLEDDDAHDA